MPFHGLSEIQAHANFQGLNDATMVISDFFSLFVGALFVLRGALSFGGFLAFVNSFWRAVTTLMQLFNRMADFHTVWAVIERLQIVPVISCDVYYRLGPRTLGKQYQLCLW